MIQHIGDHIARSARKPGALPASAFPNRGLGTRTKVIQPQINFEGVLIQVAEVEVSVGE